MRFTEQVILYNASPYEHRNFLNFKSGFSRLISIPVSNHFSEASFQFGFTFFTDNIGALLITRIWGLVGPLFGNSSLERVRLKFEPSHQQN